MRDLDLGNGLVVPAPLLRATTSRSSGPGGQNVNKVETRVTIEVEVEALPVSEEQKALIREALSTRISRADVLRVTAQSERSQVANRERALDRIEELLREALTPRAPRKKMRTPKGEKRKRLEAKKRHAEKKRLRGRIE